MEDEMNFCELQEMVSVCLEQVINLQKENQKLKMEVNQLSNSIGRIVNSQKGIVDTMNKMHEESFWKIFIQQNAINNMEYELNDPRREKSKLCIPRFCEVENTIGCIVSEKKSMARFGDGEFAIILNREDTKFQHLDEQLADRLKEVIQSNDDGILIGVADIYGSLEKYSEKDKRWIRGYLTDEVRNGHMKYLDISKKYHDARITRPYALVRDNTTRAPEKRFLELKKIWENRDVIFVEGSLTRMGVGNDLFDNAKRIRRIEAPPVNAFDKYDSILEATLKVAEEDSLFLIALGPTAGVLAYDLYKAGYQAVDIGHLDLEYEWFIQGKGDRCEVKHKYNNEIEGGHRVENIHDEMYLNQIVCIIQ